jgi:hypothetical protein
MPNLGVETRVRPTARDAVPMNWKSEMYAIIAFGSAKYGQEELTHFDGLDVRLLIVLQTRFHP